MNIAAAFSGNRSKAGMCGRLKKPGV